MIILSKFVIFLIIATTEVLCTIPNWRTNRIDAALGEFPYVVSLRRRDDGLHKCVGTIINQNWILTAALCVQGYAPYHLNVEYGSNRVSPVGGKIIPVSEIILHPEYDHHYYINNIALVRVSKPFQFDRYAQPVKLASRLTNIPSECVSFHLGWINKRDCPMDNLQKFVTITITDDEFKRSYDRRRYRTEIGARCTSFLSESCLDVYEGGPLIAQNLQVGIHSFGSAPCDGRTAPAVYTSVSCYADWITSTVSIRKNDIRIIVEDDPTKVYYCMSS